MAKSYISLPDASMLSCFELLHIGIEYLKVAPYIASADSIMLNTPSYELGEQYESDFCACMTKKYDLTQAKNEVTLKAALDDCRLKNSEKYGNHFGYLYNGMDFRMDIRPVLERGSFGGTCHTLSMWKKEIQPKGKRRRY
ncbi:MAG: hypothetical protein AB8F78_02020 [Saprospiraceae bacterium]